MTEAFGAVKHAAQRYLTTGRTTDNNLLERIVKNFIYAKDEEGHDTDEIASIVYETVVLTLAIPNFNTAVTDHLKSSIHKYVTDWVMWRFLQDQTGQADKAAEYKGLADGDDHRNIVSALNARDNYRMRTPSWV